MIITGAWVNRLHYLVGLGCSGLIILGCASHSTHTNRPSSVNPSRRIEITLHLADSLWNRRIEPDNALDAISAYEYLASKDSLALPVWTRLVHAYYYYAEYVIQADSLRRDSVLALGYNITRQVIGWAKPYRSVLASSGDSQLAIQGLSADYTGILYWGAASLAQWTSTKGDLVQRGQRPWLFAALQHIHELDSTFYFGGYDRFMGVMLCRDPLADQNARVQARRYFDASIRLAPEYLGTYTLMAHYYSPKLNDYDQFYQLLTKVITATLDVNKPYYPENYFEKQRAEMLLLTAKHEHWFTE